jgi:pyrroline-5-carboxylate reductase
VAAKKTIAILTEDVGMAGNLVNMISTEKFRIVFVTENARKFKSVAAEIAEKNQAAEVEIMNCAREGGWEADLILLATTPFKESAIANAIREVAIQKMVISVKRSDSNQNTSCKKLEKLLPHSRVVLAQINWPSPEIVLSAIDEETLQIASEIFESGGYHAKPGENWRIQRIQTIKSKKINN